MTPTDHEADSTVIHIKTKKCDSSGRSETVELHVNRKEMTYEKLRELIRQQFSIQNDFVIFYLMPEGYGRSGRYVPILSEWDISAAIFVTSDQSLLLKVDVKGTDPLNDVFQDWDILDTDDFPEIAHGHLVRSNRLTHGFGIASASWTMPFFNLWPSGRRRQSAVSAIGSEEGITRKPLGDSAFRNFFDADGRLILPGELRLRVFQGGCEQRIRSTIWPLLLGVFPDNLQKSERERDDCLRRMSCEYVTLRQGWMEKLHSRTVGEEMRWVLNAIRKDVVRTDRRHPFYAGAEDRNHNLMSLFNILTTYAIYHPQVSYCQGMSDLASPLLVVMADEALAYIVFCALMRRVRGNFQYDGRLMTAKFKDLCELLDYYDPEFYDYLREMHADDLLFCYRWLLLELKREFAFNDALRLMEVNWASINPPEDQLSLQDPEPAMVDQTLCSSCMRQMNNPHTTPVAEQSSAYMLAAFGQDDSLDTGRPIYFQPRHRFDSLSSCQSCPVPFADFFNRSNLHMAARRPSSVNSVSSLTWSSSSLPDHRLLLDPAANEERADENCPTASECTVNDCSDSCEAYQLLSPVPLAKDASWEFHGQLTMSEIQEICESRPLSSCSCSDMYSAARSRQPSGSPSINDDQQKVKSRHASTAATIAIDSGFSDSHTNVLRTPTNLTSKTSAGDSHKMDKDEMGVDEVVVTMANQVPRTKSRHKLGGGNPFLLFICVTLVLQHRDLIMQQKMNFNDIAIYFDSQMRRHDVKKVLSKARILYAQYNVDA